MRTALLLILLVSTTAHAQRRFEYSEVAMGVRARIVLYAKDEPTAQRAARAAYDRMAQLEDMMSDYRATSELSRLSAQSGGPPVEVSPELAFILGKSRNSPAGPTARSIAPSAPLSSSGARPANPANCRPKTNSTPRSDSSAGESCT